MSWIRLILISSLTLALSSGSVAQSPSDSSYWRSRAKWAIKLYYRSQLMKERLSVKDSIINKLDSLNKVFQANEVIYKRDLQLYKDQVVLFQGKEDKYFKLLEYEQKETKHYKTKSIILEIALGLLLVIEVIKH